MTINTDENRSVVVTDIKMPFGSMVIFLVKLALASIPALLIIYAVMFAFVAILVLFFGGMSGFHEMLTSFPYH